MRKTGDDSYEIRTVLPGTACLLRDPPSPVELPCDLTQRAFVRTYVSRHGAQLGAPQFATGQVTDNTVNGQQKHGFFTHPPNQGRTLLEFPMVLPAGRITFRASVGLRDGSISEGCLFLVSVTGHELVRTLIEPGAWHDLHLCLRDPPHHLLGMAEYAPGLVFAVQDQGRHVDATQVQKVELVDGIVDLEVLFLGHLAHAVPAIVPRGLVLAH